MKKVIIGILAVAAIGLGAWKYTSHPTTQNSQTGGKPIVKIGVSLPLSGDAAVFGESSKIAAKIFKDNLSKQNTFYDYQIIFEDGQFVPAKTATTVNKLISIDKTNAVVTFMSHLGAVANPIAEKAGILHFAVSTDPSVANGDYNFTIATSADKEMQTLLNHLKQQNVKSVSFVTPNSPMGVLFLDAFKTHAEKFGIKLVKSYTVNIGERDFRMILQEIKKDSPDAIITQLASPEISIFIRQYHQYGLKIPMTAAESFSFVDDKSMIEGWYYVDAAPATKGFVENYKIATGTDVTNYSEYIYAILQIMVNSFEKYAKTEINNKDVATVILNETNGLETSVGKVFIDSNGVIDGPAVLKKIENGIPVVIKE